MIAELFNVFLVVASLASLACIYFLLIDKIDCGTLTGVKGLNYGIESLPPGALRSID